MAGQTSADRGREARAKLLAAARELIGELGWGAVSTRVLAERAGVRPGLVHYHFESLQALLRRAVVDQMAEVLGPAAAALEAADDPGSAVEAMLAELDRYSGTDPASLLFIEAYLAGTRDPELHDQIAAVLRGFRAAFAEVLRRSGHRDPDGAAALVAAAFDGIVLHKGLDPDLSAARLAPLVRAVAEPNHETKGTRE